MERAAHSKEARSEKKRLTVAATRLAIATTHPLRHMFGVEWSRGFEDVDAAGVRARNVARLARLGGDGALAASVCDATAPYPPHQRRGVNLLHVPKAGTTFVAAVARYACSESPEKAAALPRYGERKDVCVDEKMNPWYGSSCDHNAASIIAALARTCKAPYALYANSTVRGLQNQDLHIPMLDSHADKRAYASRRRAGDSGENPWEVRGARVDGESDAARRFRGTYVGMFRSPGQRIASAFAFGRHLYGMEARFRDLMPKLFPDLEHYAAYPAGPEKGDFNCSVKERSYVSKKASILREPEER